MKISLLMWQAVGNNPLNNRTWLVLKVWRFSVCAFIYMIKEYLIVCEMMVKDLECLLSARWLKILNPYCLWDDGKRMHVVFEMIKYTYCLRDDRKLMVYVGIRIRYVYAPMSQMHLNMLLQMPYFHKYTNDTVKHLIFTAM